MAAGREYHYDEVAHSAFPKFPSPFGGISVRIIAETPSGLASMIRSLQRCGHGHNFAVEMDVSPRSAGALWTTDTGAFCATKGELGTELDAPGVNDR